MKPEPCPSDTPLHPLGKKMCRAPRKAPCLSACGLEPRATGGPRVWQEVGYGFAAPRRGGSPDLGLPDLVVPLVHIHLFQQGGDDLPAGWGVLGQQHLELFCEILREFGQKKVSVKGFRQWQGYGALARPWSSQVSNARMVLTKPESQTLRQLKASERPQHTEHWIF